MRDRIKSYRLSFYRQKLLWGSLLLSLLLHLALGYLAQDFLIEEGASQVFRARLLRVPPVRFIPPTQIGEGGGSQGVERPRLKIEKLISGGSPRGIPAWGTGKGTALPLGSGPGLAIMPSSMQALREIASGAKEEEPQLERVEMIRPSELGLANSTGIPSMDLLRIVDRARANKEHAAMMVDLSSRQDLLGYVNFTRLHLYGAGSDTGGSLDALARYLRDHTRLLVQVQDETYDYFLSENLLKDPIHFLFQGGGLLPYRNEVLTYFSEEEKNLLSQYLHGGGFLFVEGNNRFLREMAAHFKSLLGDEGHLVALSPVHPIYHSFYDFGGGFPGENKGRMTASVDQGWYYPTQAEPVVDPLVNPQLTRPEEEEAQLPPLGLWGVELNGELVVVLSDLGLHEGWISSFSIAGNDDAESLTALMPGTNIVVYALTRSHGLTPKEERPVWMVHRPEVPLAVEPETDRPGEAADSELFDVLDASLAVVQAPLGRELGPGGLEVRLNGRYKLEVLKQKIHGLLLHNLPPGRHWLEVAYEGKRKQLEIELQGGKVLTVTFGMNHFAFLSQLHLRKQERQVGVDQWLEQFPDLQVEELYLAEDRDLLEEAKDF